MERIIKQYRTDGYYFAENVLSQDLITALKSQLTTIEPKLYIPYSDVPWGYGNLVDYGVFSLVPKHEYIQSFCTTLFENDNYTFNHLIVNNKGAFFGSAIEWHQEMSNIGTYAPGYSVEDYENFMQIYIALDDHTIDNGCLKIIPGSDKFGLLGHRDIIGDNLGHKRRIPRKTLQYLSDEYEIKNIPMKSGDVLFFNHLMVHGSSANYTNKDRRGIVLQVRLNTKDKDQRVFDESTKHRRDFVISEMKGMINKLESTNPYKDFKKDEEKE
jgi:ectoine hydroxylase-related dioxygenase (phytanoyl-CoA dioxygenase family)